MKKPVIPVFFSVNDAYSPFLATAINSIRENASQDYQYRIHVLTDDISDQNRERLSRFSREGFQVEFYPLSELMRQLPAVQKLEQHCFGAFASLTIYFRLFIPTLFPQYDKAIYLDADLVVPGDISRLYREPLGGKLLGAVADYSIQKIGPFMHYIDTYVGVDHHNYVNSGVLLLNCKRLREVNLSGRFLDWVERYGLETVAPDQDYLNTLCWQGIHYLDPDWNAMPSECLRFMDNPQIIHFNLASKPWLNESVPYDNIFWKYAATSGYEAEIRARQKAFLQDASAMKNYKNAIKRLIRMAARLTKAPVSFRSLIQATPALRLCS
jgi:lipopolysaccharide biosynthesis glycosyltransferase